MDHKLEVQISFKDSTSPVSRNDINFLNYVEPSIGFQYLSVDQVLLKLFFVLILKLKCVDSNDKLVCPCVNPFVIKRPFDSPVRSLVPVSIVSIMLSESDENDRFVVVHGLTEQN